jgi:hypothetical protein
MFYATIRKDNSKKTNLHLLGEIYQNKQGEVVFTILIATLLGGDKL